MIDVDKTFDSSGEITLDEHRQAELGKIKQPGFGQEQPAKTPVAAASITSLEEKGENGHGCCQ